MNATKKYKEQQIKSASPTELITILYDLCLQACYSKDSQRVQNILEQLIKSLNFDYDMAGDMYSLYEYCQRAARDGNFNEVVSIISNIREAWDEAVVKDKRSSKSLNLKG